ncbi:Gfo/Idh/MocA family oxidoreductase [Streptomyces sp. H27-C3]|uniref:Gfo/Idh/MocA family protein n=1 Tax=Streptomyces sp. H27-C3 TaxID=3046305 RepID=UPI0024BB87A1|nr:Gfo/Idh/MocA family oxidoreductase [Streptomyces sp. H27-C3]MDJ0466982.1 Gfo/Idh/MocA family oxidoreductase [Streptomyces sp. H27-C3]
MNGPVRVVVVGLGWAGREIWLPRLIEHPAFEVTAVVDPAADPALLGVPLLGDIAAITSETVDLAVVAVPNHLHADIAEKLLARGIPVFLEKPVCLTSAEADRLAVAERTGGAVLLAGSAARYRTDVRALYERTAAVGRIRHIDVSWVRARGVPDSGGWFTQARLAGGGALVDLGWHLLDSVAPILGLVGITQVVGTVCDDFVNSAGERAGWRDDSPVPGSGAAGGDVEDTVRGFLVTEDGVSVALRASWASHEARDVTLSKVEGSAGVASLRCTFGFSPNREGGSDLTFTSAGETTLVPLAAERIGAERIGAEYDRQLDELPALLGDSASIHRVVVGLWMEKSEEVPAGLG